MLTAVHRTLREPVARTSEACRASSDAGMYFRRVTVPLSALPAVQEELELGDAEVHRLAVGSEGAGMDAAAVSYPGFEHDLRGLL